MEMTSKRLGAKAFTDREINLLGIVTDGDLGEMVQKHDMSFRILAKNDITRIP